MFSTSLVARHARPALASANKRGLRTSPFSFLDQTSTTTPKEEPTKLASEKQVDSADLGGQYQLHQVSGAQRSFKAVPLGAYPVSMPYEESSEDIQK